MGCPLYVCKVKECPNAPRPTCNGCEVLATRQDACGCKSYLCDVDETPEDPGCGLAKRQEEEEEEGEGEEEGEEEGTSSCGPCPNAPRPECGKCEVLATRQDACGCPLYVCKVKECPNAPRPTCNG